MVGNAFLLTFYRLFRWAKKPAHPYIYLASFEIPYRPTLILILFFTSDALFCCLVFDHASQKLFWKK